MSIREWVNQNATVITIATVVVLVTALIVVTMQLRSSVSYGIYHWDLETEQPFVAEPDLEGRPIVAPSGGRGVPARLYTCGACSPEEWFGYLEMYDEEAGDYLVRELQGDRWLSQEDPSGDRIMLLVEQRLCEETGERPRPCQP